NEGILANLATLPFRFMDEECTYVLRLYRQIDQLNRDQVKFPLKVGSWPEFGKPWEYHHFVLAALSTRVGWIVLKSEKVWLEMGWTDKPMLFRTAKDQSTI